MKTYEAPGRIIPVLPETTQTESYLLERVQELELQLKTLLELAPTVMPVSQPLVAVREPVEQPSNTNILDLIGNRLNEFAD